MAIARSTVITTLPVSEEVARHAAAESFRRLGGRDPESIHVLECRTSGIVEMNGEDIDLLAAHLAAWDFEAVF